jgi:glutamate N-acetyltransferase / amino-acid N-acetyltransferase
MTATTKTPEWVTSASPSGPLGFRAGAVEAGIKTYGDAPRLDVGVIASDRPCSVGGIFTRNNIPGAPVIISKERVAQGSAQAIVVNSGCSNVAMGARGLVDARRMAEIAAEQLGIAPELVLVASTGVIGRPLPMEKIERAIRSIDATSEGGPAFARSMMTTDTVPKVRGVRFRLNDRVYHLSGAAKGSGMCHPDMATVFCFVTTDAPISSAALQRLVARVGDASINMVDVDMDTSTSDMMIALANGAAGGPSLDGRPEWEAVLEQAMLQVCVALSKDLARDGEGAQKLLEATVCGGATLADARIAARTIVSSPLIKSMVTGSDPNLGRVLMAVGRSGADFELERLSVWIGEHQAFKQGVPTNLALDVIRQSMMGETVTLKVDLGAGSNEATAWGCDLTEDYVKINAHYTT